MNRTIIHSWKEFCGWIEERRDSNVLALDCETTSLAYLDMELVGISLCDGERVTYIDLIDNPEYNTLLKALQIFFNEFCGTLIMHNSTFDIKTLRKFGINLEKVSIFDSLIASHLLDENTPNGLKGLATILLGAPPTIEWRDAVKQGFHSQLFYDYACKDAEWTFRLWQLFAPRLEKEGLSNLFHNIEMPFVHCLVDMEINGVCIDKAKLAELRNTIDGQIKLLHIKLCQMVEVDFVLQSNLFGGEQEIIADINFDSPHQLSKLLKEKLSLDLKPNIRGHCSVDKFTLRRFSNNPFVKILMEYRRATSLRDKFIDVMPSFIQRDGRVRTSFRNTLVTGRLSSSKPNLQQISKDNTGPLKVRECIIAPPGKSLICCDFAGQELRVLAIESQDKTMAEAFRKNQDLHLTTANQFFNLNIPDDVLLVNHPRHSEMKTKFKGERDKAKTIGFGLIYGKTANGFAKDWNVSKEEAQKFIDMYFEKFPSVKRRIDKCTEDLRRQGWVVNLSGRRRRFPDYQSAPDKIKFRMERQAFNFLIQSFSADLMKWGALIAKSLTKIHFDWGCKLILTVHDEYVWEANERYAQQAAWWLKEAIEKTISAQLPIPLVIDVKTGENYSKAKP